jgi:hypothetical protein
VVQVSHTHACAHTCTRTRTHAYLHILYALGVQVPVERGVVALDQLRQAEDHALEAGLREGVVVLWWVGVRGKEGTRTTHIHTHTHAHYTHTHYTHTQIHTHRDTHTHARTHAHAHAHLYVVEQLGDAPVHVGLDVVQGLLRQARHVQRLYWEGQVQLYGMGVRA